MSRHRAGDFLRRSAFASLIAAGLAAPAAAHFDLTAHTRVILVERREDAITVFLRIPTPLVFARELARRQSPSYRVEGPFLIAEEIFGRTFHRLDMDAIEANPGRFAAFIAEGYRLAVNGRTVEPAVEAIAVHLSWSMPPFASPTEARAALAGGSVDEPRLFVGETVVDVALSYAPVDGFGAVAIESVLPPVALASGLVLENRIVDFRGDRVLVTAIDGQLAEPVVLRGSVWRAAATFVVEGIRHIVEGADHVLFVLCLALGAVSIGRLLWQVTGFTVGHSITLIAGFFGFAPQAVWFTPAVETAIALSIVYAAAVAIWKPVSPVTILVTALIGLLHGFGFSFVLAEILGPGAPHLLVSLLAFNLGVEIGQMMIVAAAFVGLRLVRLASQRAATGLRVGIAASAMAIACVWAVQRTDLLITMVEAG